MKGQTYPEDWTQCKPANSGNICLYIYTSENSGNIDKPFIVEHVPMRVNNGPWISTNSRGRLIVEVPKNRNVRIRTRGIIHYEDIDKTLKMDDGNSRIVLGMKRKIVK